MRAIIRVVREQGPAVAAAMSAAASMARSVEEIYQHALAIAARWRNAQGAVEHGVRPANPQPHFVYFCWEWDARFSIWRIAWWNGAAWVIF